MINYSLEEHLLVNPPTMNDLWHISTAQISPCLTKHCTPLD